MTWRSFPHMHNSWKKNSIQKSSTGLCVHFAGYAEIPHALQGSRSLILHVVSSQSSDHGVDFSTGICLLSACKVCWVWTSSSLLSQLAALPLIPRQTPENTWLELTSKHRWTWDSLRIIHRFTWLSHSLKSEFLTKFKAKKNLVLFSTQNIPFSFDKHTKNQYTHDLGKLQTALKTVQLNKSFQH